MNALYSRASTRKNHWELNAANAMAATRHAHFAVLTVQIFFTFRGKYTTMHLSTDIITSNVDE